MVFCVLMICCSSFKTHVSALFYVIFLGGTVKEYSLERVYCMILVGVGVGGLTVLFPSCFAVTSLSLWF